MDRRNLKEDLKEAEVSKDSKEADVSKDSKEENNIFTKK